MHWKPQHLVRWQLLQSKWRKGAWGPFSWLLGCGKQSWWPWACLMVVQPDSLGSKIWKPDSSSPYCKWNPKKKIEKQNPTSDKSPFYSFEGYYMLLSWNPQCILDKNHQKKPLPGSDALVLGEGLWFYLARGQAGAAVKWWLVYQAMFLNPQITSLPIDLEIYPP